MGKSIRIKTTPNGTDSYVNVKLDQDFDNLEILSLSISQEDVYRRHCSDYGVLVGRVTSSNGFGIPNAKLSIFIPLDDEDSKDPIKSSIYPYRSVYDRRGNTRYNLLPKSKQNRNHVPVGTFFEKGELLDDNILIEIFEKYFKYTTISNKSGDYMFFGLPLGDHQIHVDIDISDIGAGSLSPHDLRDAGFNSDLFTNVEFFSELGVNTSESDAQDALDELQGGFTSDDDIFFRSSENLDELPQIISYNSAVNIRPFWGDVEFCSEIGISRFDIDLTSRFDIKPTALLFGFLMTNSGFFVPLRNIKEVGPIGLMNAMVPPDLDNPIESIICRTTSGGVVDLADRVVYNKDSGVWYVRIPMMEGRVITDELGVTRESENKDRGVPTYTDCTIKFKPASSGDGYRNMTLPGEALFKENRDVFNDNMFGVNDTFGFPILALSNNGYRVRGNRVYTTAQRIHNDVKYGIRNTSGDRFNDFPSNGESGGIKTFHNSVIRGTLFFINDEENELSDPVIPTSYGSDFGSATLVELTPDFNILSDDVDSEIVGINKVHSEPTLPEGCEGSVDLNKLWSRSPDNSPVYNLCGYYYFGLKGDINSNENALGFIKNSLNVVVL